MPHRWEDAEIDELLVEHLPWLVGLVRMHSDPVIREHESCADIVQSVCRDVLAHAERFQFRGPTAFRNWLYTQSLAKLATHRRYYLAQKRDVRREQPLDTTGSQAGVAACDAATCSPSETAIGRETEKRFESAFAQLPEDYKRVISLARMNGMSHAEIGAEMGRGEGAVRILLHRALSRLGRLMNDLETSG